MDKKLASLSKEHAEERKQLLAQQAEEKKQLHAHIWSGKVLNVLMVCITAAAVLKSLK